MKRRGAVEDVVLWRTRAPVQGSARDVECLVEQLGEGSFELRLVAAGERILSETFEDPAALLDRAEGLRAALRSRAR